jgi:hypothetical protein
VSGVLVHKSSRGSVPGGVGEGYTSALAPGGGPRTSRLAHGPQTYVSQTTPMRRPTNAVVLPGATTTAPTHAAHKSGGVSARGVTPPPPGPAPSNSPGAKKNGRVAQQQSTPTHSSRPVAVRTAVRQSPKQHPALATAVVQPPNAPSPGTGTSNITHTTTATARTSDAGHSSARFRSMQPPAPASAAAAAAGSSPSVAPIATPTLSAHAGTLAQYCYMHACR